MKPILSFTQTLLLKITRHAPIVTKFITVRPLVPWFSEDIRDSRRERRRAERKWRRSRSVNDLLEFKKKRNFTTYLMNEARRKFYSDFIVENNSNQRNLFSATKRLLNQGHEVPFPVGNVLLSSRVTIGRGELDTIVLYM